MSKQYLPDDSQSREAYIGQFRHTSLRLTERDYTKGVYHVVTCSKGIAGRGPLFLQPVLCQLVQTNWLELPLRFPNCYVEALVVMPDHIHFVIWMNKWPDHLRGKPAPTLFRVMQSYKSKVACERIQFVEQNMPTASGLVWQDGYFERALRYGKLDTVRKYISANPLQDGTASTANWESLYDNMGWQYPRRGQALGKISADSPASAAQDGSNQTNQ